MLRERAPILVMQVLECRQRVLEQLPCHLWSALEERHNGKAVCAHGGLLTVPEPQVELPRLLEGGRRRVEPAGEHLGYP
jgi:hypothetical protein